MYILEDRRYALDGKRGARYRGVSCLGSTVSSILGWGGGGGLNAFVEVAMVVRITRHPFCKLSMLYPFLSLSSFFHFYILAS